jgi:hypothetical protein
MNKDLFGKTLAECQGYQFTAVKANENGKKYMTINNQPGTRDTAINLYLSNNLASKMNVGQYVDPTCTIREMDGIDEETGEKYTWPLLTSSSTYVTLEQLMAMSS